ncbi:MAG: hypothetical protein QF560_13785 [SAR324 cluster bacterium]|nr:hypothetical protein [SAR324 cluster bacterium]HJL87038.1 hypothetical protein [SAR324 cluster bacterium]
MIVPLLAGCAKTLNENPIVGMYQTPGVPCKEEYPFWPYIAGPL